MIIYAIDNVVTYFILIDKYVILNAIDELIAKEICKFLIVKLTIKHDVEERNSKII